jgi:glycosyltransferase involved in cell wall biosynthesis
VGGLTNPRVVLVCSGLDHARRGFESFARECFEALRGEAGIELELLKGSGRPGPGERPVATLRRDRLPARALGRLVGARPFRVEALAFGLALLPRLARRRPDLVYLSEWDTARALAAVRSLTGLQFKLLLCNGGFAWQGFEHLDQVQELTPPARDYVLERGGEPRRHTVLPLGFRLGPVLRAPSAEERAGLRKRWDLPADREIVISVAALNRRHKRLDYVVEEVAGLPEPRPFLLLVGEPDAETPGLRRLAADRLGPRGHALRTVAVAEVPDLLRASDRFVLASLVEAQGRALIEAAGQGVPCIAHESAVTRFALGEYGLFGDLTRPGALTRLLLRAPDPELAVAAHRHVYEHFSWDRLRPRYAELFRRVIYDGSAAPEDANNTVSSSTGENVSR